MVQKISFIEVRPVPGDLEPTNDAPEDQVKRVVFLDTQTIPATALADDGAPNVKRNMLFADNVGRAMQEVIII